MYVTIADLSLCLEISGGVGPSFKLCKHLNLLTGKLHIMVTKNDEMNSSTMKMDWIQQTIDWRQPLWVKDDMLINIEDNYATNAYMVTDIIVIDMITGKSNRIIPSQYNNNFEDYMRGKAVASGNQPISNEAFSQARENTITIQQFVDQFNNIDDKCITMINGLHATKTDEMQCVRSEMMDTLAGVKADVAALRLELEETQSKLTIANQDKTRLAKEAYTMIELLSSVISDVATMKCKLISSTDPTTTYIEINKKIHKGLEEELTELNDDYDTTQYCDEAKSAIASLVLKNKHLTTELAATRSFIQECSAENSRERGQQSIRKFLTPVSTTWWIHLEYSSGVMYSF